MPIQVIDHSQAPQNTAWDKHKARQLKVREMSQNARYKAGQLKIYAEQNRINAMTAESDIDKQQFEIRSKTIEGFSKTMGNIGLALEGGKIAPEEAQKEILRAGQQWDIAKFQKEDPAFNKIIVGSEQREEDSTARKNIAQEGYLQASDESLRNEGGGGQGGAQIPPAQAPPQGPDIPGQIANDLQGGGQPEGALRPTAASRSAMISAARPGAANQGAPENQGRSGVLADTIPTNIRKGTSYGPTGATQNFINPRAQYESARATNLAKPFTSEEARIYSSAGTVVNAINELEKLVDAGEMDILLTQSLVDYGDPKTTLRFQEGTKNAIGYMNHLKNLIPFARGGKQLTPFEAKLVFRLINTQGKTRSMIKRDLGVYKREFKLMMKGITTPRGEIDISNLGALNFGGGKDYGELIKPKQKAKGSDPLGLFN